MTERRSNEIKEAIQIHERMATMETNVNTIMNNHLPHIQAAIDKLGENVDRRLNKIDTKFWAIIILLISTLVGLVALNYKS